MSEVRPVPRRESPWGLPEGDKWEPKGHRCNDRAEDVVQACFEGNPFKTVPGPFKLFWTNFGHAWNTCRTRVLVRHGVRHGLAGFQGGTNHKPYTYLQLDPPKRVEVKLE